VLHTEAVLKCRWGSSLIMPTYYLGAALKSCFNSGEKPSIPGAQRLVHTFVDPAWRSGLCMQHQVEVLDCDVHVAIYGIIPLPLLLGSLRTLAMSLWG
jgi:hypothetical protein